MSRRRTKALPIAKLAKPLRRSISEGHPWIFDRAIRVPRQCEAGDVVVIEDDAGPIATGYVDPRSPIRCRVLALGEEHAPSDKWIETQALTAGRLRKSHPHLSSAEALRLIHGENDGMPGLVLDWYAGHGVLRYDGRGARGFWQNRLPAVVRGLEKSGFQLASVWSRDGVQIAGTTPKEIVIKEGGAQFFVDVHHGHKTGFFLDQRRNRALVGLLAKDKRVLDLFSYSGGFGVHAIAGGAKEVTFVDSAKKALAAAQKNAAETMGDSKEAKTTFAPSDVFEFLESCTNESFDLVICDPPSFAPSEQVKKKALVAYEKLNRMAAEKVATGGMLCTASCSSHVSHREFDEMLLSALAPDTWRFNHRSTADADHPARPVFPEGDYLTFRVLSKMG